MAHRIGNKKIFALDLTSLYQKENRSMYKKNNKQGTYMIYTNTGLTCCGEGKEEEGDMNKSERANNKCNVLAVIDTAPWRQCRL